MRKATKFIWYKPLNKQETQNCLDDLELLKKELKKAINKKIAETSALQSQARFQSEPHFPNDSDPKTHS